MSHKTNGANGRAESAAVNLVDTVPFQPVYFSSLEVENYRCFGSKQTLNLFTEGKSPAQWTVILGENGVGKTTVLRMFAFLQPVKLEDSISSAPVKRIYAMPKFANRAFLGGAWANISSAPKVKGNPLRWSATYTFASFLEKSSADKTYLSLSVNIDVRSRSDVGDSRLANMACFGYGASRRMGKSNLSDKRNTDTCASLFNDDAELLNAEEWLLQADYAANRESPRQRQAVKQRDRIKDILIHLLPDVEDIRIAEREGTLSSPKVEFQTPYGWVQLQDLSLGYRALITWMVDLASRLFDRYPDSPDPLAEPAVVLVDEIDLHLHPRWQRTLMQFLSDIFKQTQFIVTAHSPLVVQAADENANIVLLRREGDHVIIENDVKTIRGWRVDQILTSDLFGLETARPPQYDEAIKERTALLSKGRLTKKDEARLAELEKQIDELPTGESPSDMEAMDIIRQAAELLKTK